MMEQFGVMEPLLELLEEVLLQLYNLREHLMVTSYNMLVFPIQANDDSIITWTPPGGSILEENNLGYGAINHKEPLVLINISKLIMDPML